MFNFAYSLQRAIVLPLPNFWKQHLNFFGELGYTVFIHNRLLCVTAAFFHTFEKNILVAVKNWWSLTYGQVYIYIYICWEYLVYTINIMLCSFYFFFFAKTNIQILQKMMLHYEKQNTVKLIISSGWSLCVHRIVLLVVDEVFVYTESYY